ncbi:MAG: YgeY family selenium metabolism-linked hydrolase [Sphaerochaeta sp.]|uniref:YgeY family selenium metabolism-linked hydrolase n=3 Tax=unclassified Sphaerochaeta TaxID=2637943 RepID=UPI003D135F93
MQTNEQLITLCQDLIKHPSLSGFEKEAASFIQKTMQSLAYDEVSIDAYGSVVGSIFGSQEGPAVLMDGHIDTVGVENPNLWNHDPFAGRLTEGRIYGRGSSDMKGALSAMMLAASEFKKKTGGKFRGSLHVSATVCEECFEGISSRLVTKFVKPDVVIVGEASSLAIKRGQRGRAEVVLQTFGKSCHSSNPDEGVNAVTAMLTLLPEILALKAPHHPVLGEGILVLTDIVSSPYPALSVVPESCKVTFDRRLLVGETEKSILAPIQQILDKHPDIRATVSVAEGSLTCYTGKSITAKRFFPAWLLDEDHPLVQAAKAALPSSPLSHYSFCTNASHFCAEAGIPTIGYGPSEESLAHTVDEYISTAQLSLALDGYLALLDHLLV